MWQILVASFYQSLSWQGFGTLLALVTLETILSADNAVALAALAGEIENPQEQNKALNWGMILAFILRILLLITATWVMGFWQFEMAGGIYLIWLAGKHFSQYWHNSENEDDQDHQSSFEGSSFFKIIGLIALTDLAFSVDSVTAAVGFSNQLFLVVLGCTLGIIALRFLAGLFVQWLTEFFYLADAAYMTILAVGMRLVFKVIYPQIVPPQWFMLILMVSLFAWGFSQRIKDSKIGNTELIIDSF